MWWKITAPSPYITAPTPLPCSVVIHCSFHYYFWLLLYQFRVSAVRLISFSDAIWSTKSIFFLLLWQSQLFSSDAWLKIDRRGYKSGRFLQTSSSSSSQLAISFFSRFCWLYFWNSVEPSMYNAIESILCDYVENLALVYCNVLNNFLVFPCLFWVVLLLIKEHVPNVFACGFYATYSWFSPTVQKHPHISFQDFNELKPEFGEKKKGLFIMKLKAIYVTKWRNWTSPLQFQESFSESDFSCLLWRFSC